MSFLHNKYVIMVIKFSCRFIDYELLHYVSNRLALVFFFDRNLLSMRHIIKEIGFRVFYFLLNLKCTLQDVKKIN